MVRRGVGTENDSIELPGAADVVVIGGGIAGCSTAYHLARRGVQVVLCERREVAAEQSGRNWGLVQRQGRNTAELPLMVESHKMWERLEQELGESIDWVQGGNLILAANERRLTFFRQWLESARQFDLDTRILSAEEIAALIPSMGPRFVGGLYTASDGHADPVKATTAFCQAAIKYRASVFTHCPVESIVTSEGGVSGVVTRRGTIRTNRVVCAAGVWSANLLRPLGLGLARRLVRATVARTRPVQAVTTLGVWGPAVAFRQRLDGRFDVAGMGGDYDITLDSFRHLRLLLPSYRHHRKLFRFHVGRPLLRDLMAQAPWSGVRRHPFAYDPRAEPRADASRVKHSVREFCRLFPSLDGVALEQSWAGYIDATPDALPVLGEVATPRGLVLATGFSGQGFSLGPIVGRLVSELIVDRKPTLDLHPFRFSRFGGGQ
jgi:glycine/D-amino acid oxidase-like deaminating enzyme